MSKYYDGTKLLSMLDINGNKPEIYMCTSNRTAGKTTYFNRLCVNSFIKKGEKFGVLYRFNYELDDVSNKFFKDIGSLFFHGHTMENKRRASGIFHELFLDNKSCGYAISLNSSDQIKKYSHLFSDITRLVFDEFQSENNHYCNDEIKKFISVHTSIARGQGKQVRYVPVYMISNPVSLINPYYVTMGVSNRLKSNTKFLKGDGFVLEQSFNNSAKLEQNNSGFNKAFSNNIYTSYASESVYLNDNTAFIEKPSGKNIYLCTLKYNNTFFAIREYTESGFLYCDDKADLTFNLKIAVTTEDHQINFVMLKRNDFFLSNLRYLYERGCFRFKDLRCKEAVLNALSY